MGQLSPLQYRAAAGVAARVDCAGAVAVRRTPKIHAATTRQQTIAVLHAGHNDLQLLEGFVQRDMIKLSAAAGPRTYRAMMSAKVDACSVREPWTRTEKNGPVMSKVFIRHGLATPEISAEA